LQGFTISGSDLEGGTTRKSMSRPGGGKRRQKKNVVLSTAVFCDTLHSGGDDPGTAKEKTGFVDKKKAARRKQLATKSKEKAKQKTSCVKGDSGIFLPRNFI